MATVRATFRCEEAVPRDEGDTGGNVVMRAVSSTDPNHENKAFWDATPDALLSMGINNPAGFAAFEQAKEYSLDFTPAES